MQNMSLFENAHAVEARNSFWLIWRAGRRLITMRGWSIENATKTRVFESVANLAYAQLVFVLVELVALAAV